MRDSRFEWDDEKAARNAAKHGVTFEAAREAFDDPNALEDPDHDPGEERWKLIGMTRTGLLLVVHTDRHERHRIISARKATSHEKARYRGQARP